MKRRINTLFVDRSGKLWIGSQGDGVSVFENGDITKIEDSEPVVGEDVKQFTEDSRGAIWRASLRGIHFYENNTLKSIPGAGLSRGTSYRVVYDSYSEGVYGCYWESIGTWLNGVFLRLQESRSGRNVSSNNFFERKHGGIWVLSSDLEDYGALHRLMPNGELTQSQTWPMKIPQYGIGAFLEDTSGALWISIARDAVYRFDPDGFYERLDLANGSVTTLFEDRDGSIWAGSPVAGLSRIKRRVFRSYPSAGVSPVQMLFSDHKDGVLFTKGHNVYQANLQGLLPLQVTAQFGALLDRNGFLWAGLDGAFVKFQWNESHYERIDISKGL